jgi:hypothetical protein
VPFLNRALAEEQLGVAAGNEGNTAEAHTHFDRAIQVGGLCLKRNALDFGVFIPDKGLRVLHPRPSVCG